MGRRGPGKTPTAQLKARGTFRKDRHSDDIDSQLAPQVPTPPADLTDDERALWQRIGTMLASRGLMTELDGMALELLVKSYAGMNSTLAELSSQDLVYMTESGAPVINPLVGVHTKQVALLKWCLQQFGCTPSARTGIRTEATPKKGPEDPMAKLLGNK